MDVVGTIDDLDFTLQQIYKLVWLAPTHSLLVSRSISRPVGWLVGEFFNVTKRVPWSCYSKGKFTQLLHQTRGVTQTYLIPLLVPAAAIIAR